LLAIGEWVRDRDAVWEVKLPKNSKTRIDVSLPPVVLAVVLFALGAAWKSWMDAAQENKAQSPASFVNAPASFIEIETTALTDFVPELSKPTATKAFITAADDLAKPIIYQAWFDGQSSELVSGLHRLYNEKSWSLSQQFRVTTAKIDRLPVRLISDPVGNLRLVAFWYDVDSSLFTQATKAKLYQTANVLRGEGAAGLMMIISVPVTSGSEEEIEEAKSQLTGIVDQLEVGSK